MDLVLSIMSLAAVALVLGAIWLWRKDAAFRKQALLMLFLAAVMAVNVAIWTIPTSEGVTPVDQLEAQAGE